MRSATLYIAAALSVLCATWIFAQAETRPSPGRTDATVEVVLFWEPGCPFCRKAKTFLNQARQSRPWLDIAFLDVTANSDNLRLFEHANELFSIAPAGVPLVVVGERFILGFDTADKAGAEILQAAEGCRARGCMTLAQLVERGSKPQPAPTTASRKPIPEKIEIPLVGTISIASLSLPALTIVLAAIDGFNPCAMWVLIFLVGLLVGVQDRVRMWLLGGVFLLTSGIVYYGFLAAWLNVFLVLGAIVWIRLAVGLIALASGAYYLHAFATDAASECRVTNLSQRQRIMSALRESVSEKRFLVAVAGIVILAAAVNLIELFCSAGIPAVYTDVLAMNNLPWWQYYLYLLLYVSVFMADDAAIFVTAMVTLNATSMTNRYLRWSHLLGGLGMIAIGFMLLFAPEWLAFSRSP